MFKWVVTIALLLSVTHAVRYRARDSIGGLRATGLGCRWAGESYSGTAGTRTCYTAYQSQVGARALQRAPAAAGFCQRLHDGWLATVPNQVVQDWLEEALNLTYVSKRPLLLVGDFWFGAELIGGATRRWSWKDGSAIMFTNWHRGYPMSTTRNACAHLTPTRISINETRWIWKNDACYKTKNFICEHREPNQTSAIQLCGRPAIEPNVNLRVVSGVPALPHSWPWMVSFQVRMEETHEYTHICGGSLINDRWILTAAHCKPILDLFPYQQVAIGLHWLRHPRPGAQDYTVRAEISRLLPSPTYKSPKNNSNDIMLVELTHPVTFNEAVSPICLPASTQTVTSGRRCYTSGWGRTSGGLALYDSNALRQVELPIIDRKVCNQTLWYNGRIDDSMVCAGYEYGGRDTCQGDSGGALVCFENDRWIQYGITSFGDGCGEPRKPGVYSLVSNHRRWIEQTIREASSP